MMDNNVELLNKLINVGKRLSSSVDVDLLLAELSDCAKSICDSEWASILLVDSSTNELWFKVSSGGQANAIKKIRLSMGTGIAGWVAQNNQSLIVNDVSSDQRFFGNQNDQFKMKTKNILAVPIQFRDAVIGVIEVGNKLSGPYSDREQEYLEIIAGQSGIALNNAFLMQSLNNFKIHALDIIVMAIDETSPFKKGHSMDVARIATSIARELNLNDQDYQNIYYAALLHDIGWLNKEVADLGNRHPSIGSSMVEHIEALKEIAPLIHTHHERYDGSGYPNGILGRSASLSARILSFSEHYVEYISEGLGDDPLTGSQFDGNIVQTFKRIISKNALR